MVRLEPSTSCNHMLVPCLPLKLCSLCCYSCLPTLISLRHSQHRLTRFHLITSPDLDSVNKARHPKHVHHQQQYRLSLVRDAARRQWVVVGQQLLGLQLRIFGIPGTPVQTNQ